MRWNNRPFKARPSLAAYTIYIDGQAVQFAGFLVVSGDTAFCGTVAAILGAVAPALLNSGVGRRIAATGRMAFSNYIGTSLVMALVFQGWGLGLFGQLDKVERLLPLFAVWVLMLIWSPAWLARFRFGPLEWLWRCLTYWKRFPIRRSATA